MNNDNHNCLPFYHSLNEQNAAKNYAYGNIYPLYAPNDRLLPFQLFREHKASSVWSIILHSLEEGQADIDITSAVTGVLGWNVVENSHKALADNAWMDTIVCCPQFAMEGVRIPIGRWYIELSDGENQWWSDIFTVVQNHEQYLRIEWTNLSDVQLNEGAILYKNLGFTFTNVLYLATELGKPEYPFEEEGENRDGYFFAEKQISSKTYKATISAPEYLCDCLRLVRMADLVNVRDGYGREYSCDTFLATPTWQEYGDIAEVALEFTTGTIVKHIGHGWTRSGDYDSADFNDDYDI